MNGRSGLIVAPSETFCMYVERMIRGVSSNKVYESPDRIVLDVHVRSADADHLTASLGMLECSLKTRRSGLISSVCCTSQVPPLPAGAFVHLAGRRWLSAVAVVLYWRDVR